MYYSNSKQGEKSCSFSFKIYSIENFENNKKLITRSRQFDINRKLSIYKYSKEISLSRRQEVSSHTVRMTCTLCGNKSIERSHIQPFRTRPKYTYWYFKTVHIREQDETFTKSMSIDEFFPFCELPFILVFNQAFRKQFKMWTYFTRTSIPSGIMYFNIRNCERERPRASRSHTKRVICKIVQAYSNEYQTTRNTQFDKNMRQSSDWTIYFSIETFYKMQL